MIKKILVFTDLDGTLLDHFTYDTSPADEMITRLKQDDISIIPNSSKTLSEISLIREQLSLTSPFIIENGAAVYIPINYFQKQPEDTHIDNGFWVKSFCQKKQHWLSLLEKEKLTDKYNFQGFSEMSVEQLADLTGLSHDNAALAKQRQYGEPLNWLDTEQAQDELTDRMTELGANVLQGGRFLHISGHTDKGFAQQWLTEQYQHIPVSPAYLNNLDSSSTYIDKVISIAIGDGKNDIAMLEQATIAVQVRSPVHDFPTLKRTELVYQSRQFGPAGWAECLHEILSSKIDVLN